MKRLMQTASLMTLANIKQLWHEMNEACFDNALKQPKFLIEPDIDHLVPPRYRPKPGEGHIYGFCDFDHEEPDQLVLLFRYDPKIPAHELMRLVAHEICHQYLAQTLAGGGNAGYMQMMRVGHGPVFRALAARILRYHNTILPTDYLEDQP